VTIVSIDVRELDEVRRWLSRVSEKDIGRVMTSVLNRVGDQVFTRVVRVLAGETGAKSSRVRRALGKWRASAGREVYRIVARDQFLSLKEFGPRQTRRGVSAAPWKKRRVFPGTFMGPGEHVFRRKGRSRLPIHKLWGPAIPREMVRGEAKKEVEALVRRQLPERTAHEVRRVLSRT